MRMQRSLRGMGGPRVGGHLVVSVLILLCVQPLAAGWRSELFPEGWVPLDERIVDGVNRFLDPAGTVDSHGERVTDGSPSCHPYRFLHDFSYAGYRLGERAIPPEDPSWKAAGKVHDVTLPPYDCIPDGRSTHDCRPGIQEAIRAAEAAGGGIVYLPAGDYYMTSPNTTEFLRITKGNVVLRGAGPGETRLKVDPYRAGRFEMQEKCVIRVVGGRLWTDDAKASKVRQPVAADILFPTRSIPVRDASVFSAGDPVILQGYRTAAFLREHDMAGTWPEGSSAYVFRRTVTNVDAARNRVDIDIPTRYRIRLTDAPEVIRVSGGISEVGLEGFSVGILRHPDEWSFRGEIADALAAGAPPIVRDLWKTTVFRLTNVRDSWIHAVESYRPSENAGRHPTNAMTGRRFGDYEVEILNEAICLEQCSNVTLKDLRFRNAQVDYGSANGYAVRIQGNDMLLENVIIEKFKKAFCLYDSWTSGNVLKDCTTRDVFANPDLFHWRLSMANLVDNHTLDGPWWRAVVESMDVGASGNSGQGHGTTQTVFWNLRGLRRPDTGIRGIFDRDNDEDGIPDSLESHGDIDDVALVVSNQFGWGYVIGTHGAFSDVLTPRMQRHVDGDWSRPTTSPRDWAEGIGYDRDPRLVGDLEPRSLHEAQLARRTGRAAMVDTRRDVVLDNGERGTRASGSWLVSRGTSPWGPRSLYSKKAGARYTFRPELPAAGRYDVYLWWTPFSNRLAEVPVEVTHSSGIAVVRVNQQRDGGRWNRIGTWSFGDAEVESGDSGDGSSGRADSGDADSGDGDSGRGDSGSWGSRTDAAISVISLGGGTTCADAVRLVAAGTGSPAIVAPDAIVDDDQPGTTATGPWAVSGGKDAWGGGSLYSRTAGARYTFEARLESPGRHDVYVWWTPYPSRREVVPIEVVHSTGTDTVSVNQRKNGGRWNWIGAWDFGDGDSGNGDSGDGDSGNGSAANGGAGATATISVISLGGNSTCADAVRIVPAIR